MATDRDDIDRVRQATNLVELLEGVTKVRRSGSTFMAVCPFHQEKTASMSVDPARGLYNCFGCGKSGDIFTFVQETQGLQFPEALEFLADRAGIQLTRDPKAAKRRGERQATVDALRAAVDFYQKRLKSGADAGHARSYVRSRGYDVGVVDTFEIGYSPEEWDLLVKELRAQGIAEKDMIGAGLAKRGRGGKLYDQFRGRLMFPIRDLRGDPVGFGARLLRGEGAKYLNSPETRLYQKAKLLYGLDRAKSDIARAGYAVVVEGYTDVIALHLAGYPRAVATCGTALGEDHFDLLRRFADKVVLAFDADTAGAGAAVRGDELSTPSDLGLDLRVAIMPEGRDPAELVQDGDVSVLQKAVDDSVPMIQFRLERELERFPLNEPEARARAIRAAAPHIGRLGDELARREYARFVSRRTGTELEAVMAAVVQAGRGSRPGSAAGPPEPPPDDDARPLSGTERAEQEMLRLYIDNGVASSAKEPFSVDIDMFSRPVHAATAERLRDILVETPYGTAPDLVGLADDQVGRLIRRLAVVGRPLSNYPAVRRRLEEARLDDQINRLRTALDGLDPDTEPQAYSDTFQELIALEQRKRQVRED